MSKFRIFSGNPTDPGIEQIEAYSFEVDQYGNLIFKMSFPDGFFTGAVYAGGFWYKVERVYENK